MFASSVAETCQLAHVLGISHEPLVDRVHRVLKGEWVLKLSDFHLEELIFLPLGEEIHHAWAVSQSRGVAIELYLGLPVEVLCDATFQRDTSHTYIERVGLCSLLTIILVLEHTVARQFYIAQP